jgi:hypothetical protein
MDYTVEVKRAKGFSLIPYTACVWQDGDGGETISFCGCRSGFTRKMAERGARRLIRWLERPLPEKELVREFTVKTDA